MRGPRSGWRDSSRTSTCYGVKVWTGMSWAGVGAGRERGGICTNPFVQQTRNCRLKRKDGELVVVRIIYVGGRGKYKKFEGVVLLF